MSSKSFTPAKRYKIWQKREFIKLTRRYGVKRAAVISELRGFSHRAVLSLRWCKEVIEIRFQQGEERLGYLVYPDSKVTDELKKRVDQMLIEFRGDRVAVARALRISLRTVFLICEGKEYFRRFNKERD